jgi:PadR family transcriptional regulator, regulatory protein PadR
MAKPTDFVPNTLDLLVLKTLALQPMHGWGIAQRIRQVSKYILQVNQGALCPALHRLEQQGWIRAKWGESENNRRAKFYSLMPDRAKYLLQEQAQWKRLTLAIELVLETQ